MREVYSLAHGIVSVFLEGRLDTNVPFRVDIVGSGEQPFHLLWDPLDLLDSTLLGNLLHQFVAVETSCL